MSSDKNETNSELPTTNGEDQRLKAVPTWITAEVFEDLLKQLVPDYDKVLNFKACPAMAPGENYATLMLRVSIDVQLKDKSEQHLSFMMKVPHDSEQMRQMLNFMNFFTTERGALKDILPELEEMYSDAGVQVKFGPTIRLLPGKETDNYVLMDDLGVNGFRNAVRTECLDMDHALLVLEKLAQYHAGGAVRVATKGPYADIYMKGIQSEEGKQIWAGMMASFKGGFMSNVHNYKDGEKYKKAVASFFDNIMDRFQVLMFPDADDFNVLIHGDCWSNNILFKYSDEGKVEEMKFVDFQMPRWGSPVQDLLYFILSSIRIGIKLPNFDYFLRYYYDHLVANLKLLNYPKKMPDLRELFMATFKYGDYGLMTSVMILPVILLDSTDKAEFANFMSDTEAGVDFKNMLYANKRYHAYISELLPWFWQRGILNDE